MDSCAKCGTTIRGNPFWSPLGEKVCATCHDRIVGAVIGIESGGGIGEAVALGADTPTGTAGVLAWIRGWFGRDHRAPS